MSKRTAVYKFTDIDQTLINLIENVRLSQQRFEALSDLGITDDFDNITFVANAILDILGCPDEQGTIKHTSGEPKFSDNFFCRDVYKAMICGCEYKATPMKPKKLLEYLKKEIKTFLTNSDNALF